MKITPAIREYAEKKINGLKHLMSGINFDIEIFIELGKTTGKTTKGAIYFTEVMITFPGKILRATQEDLDIYAAIDKVRDEIKIEIQKYKGRDESRSKKEARFFKVLKNLSQNTWDLRNIDSELPEAMAEEKEEIKGLAAPRGKKDKKGA